MVYKLILYTACFFCSNKKPPKKRTGSRRDQRTLMAAADVFEHDLRELEQLDQIEDMYNDIYDDSITHLPMTHEDDEHKL